MRREEADQMSIDALEVSITNLIAKKADIDEQVNFAKRTAAAGGEYADPDWLGRSELAARLTGRDIRIMQDALGKKKRAEKDARSSANIASSREASKERHATFSGAFIKIAKEQLPESMFNHLVDEAARACGQA